MKRLVLGLLMVLAACDGGNGEPAGTATATGASRTGPAETTQVPDMSGAHLGVARAAAGDAELTMLIEERRYSRQPVDVVLRQEPEAGESVPVGTTVYVVVARPFPRIPSVVGRSEARAKVAVKAAGYLVRVTKRDSTTHPDGEVVRQRPRGSTEARPGRLVTIVVVNNTCTPGYRPCIRQGRDVDCLPANGANGPRFTSMIYRVTGVDVYDLDDDEDGVGCD